MPTLVAPEQLRASLQWYADRAFWERDTTEAGWKTIDAPFGGAAVIKFAASKDRFYALAEADYRGRPYATSVASMGSMEGDRVRR